MGQSGQVGPGTGVEIPGRSQKAPSQSPPSFLALGAGVLCLIWGDTNTVPPWMPASTCPVQSVTSPSPGLWPARGSQHWPSSLFTVSPSATGNRLSSLLLLLSYSLKDIDNRVQSLRDTCSRLPQDSYNNLRCFVRTGLLQPQAITRGIHSLLKSILTKPLLSFHPAGI